VSTLRQVEFARDRAVTVNVIVKDKRTIDVLLIASPKNECIADVEL